MRRTLLVTNDFPPRAGGIQSYLHAIAQRLPAAELVVYAPAWDGAAEFDAQQRFTVVRHPTSLMLPTPAVAGRAAALLAEHQLTGVWFGAAAPLALLSPYLRRHGAQRIVASTHGHEVGWSMLPGARQALRAIGNGTDVLTFVSRYARRRFAAAFGANAALEYLPPGVDTSTFHPDPIARQRIRERWGLSDQPVIVCVSRLVARKGQDQLIAALPAIRRASPDAMLLIIGSGPDADRLHRLAASKGVRDAVLFTGAVPTDELAAHLLAGDLFAMPCRTRGGGLDVEGLGIVFLEASACGLPVVAGDSGGAPEAVQQDKTGLVVDGTDPEVIAAACVRVLGDADLRRTWGAAGRQWVRTDWNWQQRADRLVELLC
ncbi:MAG: glycosyltransferase family 4 protein [Nakamurella sp.]